MPRRAKDVRPENAAGVESAIDVCVGQPRGAEAESPFRTDVVLRLDGAEPGHDLFGVPKRGVGKPLVV